MLDDLGNFNNALGKHTKNLKVFMRWAHEKGYTNNEYYKKIKVAEETEKDIIALTEEQVKKIENLELNDKLDRVRDLFLLECYCGLRFSDIQNLKQENIQDGKINVGTVKTKQRLIIPIHNRLQKILDKYFKEGNELPKISNQKMNDYLKELGEEAELTDEFEYVQHKGKEKVPTTFKTYEKLTTHIARHTFVTLSLKRKMDHESIMKVVGHKAYNTLKKYIHYNEAHIIQEMDKWNK